MLSQARAEAVRIYLIGKGISGDRLTAKGYGESSPGRRQQHRRRPLQKPPCRIRRAEVSEPATPFERGLRPLFYGDGWRRPTSGVSRVGLVALLRNVAGTRGATSA
jgi:hypothetical protein